MSKETTKIKNPNMKSNVPRSADFETFIKNQQNIVGKLKNELKSIVSAAQLLDCARVEKDKRINELELSVNQRDAEIHKLSANLDELKEVNSNILMEFNFFKEKFYQLEIDYDRTLNKEQETANALEQLLQHKTVENQELSSKCQGLQRRLQNTIDDLTQLNKLHLETLQNYEQIKSNFEKEQKEYELYREEKILNDEKSKLAIDELREELRQKDERLNKCISDKDIIEKEKNLIIDELNNKILRIERAFCQPTKVVQPLVNLPGKDKNLDNNSNSESSNDNVAASSKPQERKPLASLPVFQFSNNENQELEQKQTQLNYKFKRPVQPQTSSQLSNVATTNVATNRKRRAHPLRQQSAIKYNEFSSSSSDESNYNGFSQNIWRPNKEFYVADTDASEGFAKSKRSKN